MTDVELEAILAAEAVVDELIRKQLNKEKYGWSKHGGGRKGLYKGNLSEEWFCQACGDAQPSEFPPYSFKVFPGEYIRICGKCHRLVKAEQITEMRVLMWMVHKA